MRWWPEDVCYSYSGLVLTFVISFNLIQHHSQLDAHLFCGGVRGAVGIVKLPAPGLILDALFGSRFMHESMVFLSST